VKGGEEDRLSRGRLRPSHGALTVGDLKRKSQMARGDVSRDTKDAISSSREGAEGGILSLEEAGETDIGAVRAAEAVEGRDGREVVPLLDGAGEALGEVREVLRMDQLVG